MADYLSPKASAGRQVSAPLLIVRSTYHFPLFLVVDIINLAVHLTKEGDQKVMEKLKRHEVDKRKLLKAFKKICPTIEI